jgi:hypothetical protein
VLTPEFLATKERCLRLLTTGAFPSPVHQRDDRQAVA